MEYLQQEIKIDIFSRIPTESILKCRQVCKSWESLLHLPYFIDMHIQYNLLQQKQLDDNQDSDKHCTNASPPTLPPFDSLGFLFLTLERSSPLYYLEYNENERCYKTLTKIIHPLIKKRKFMIAVVGSCNGLICFSIPHTKYGVDDPVYICNPIVNECTNLPKLDIVRDYEGVAIDKESSMRAGRMVSGFGYDPYTKEYKVVRIVYYDINSVGRVQVYTLGDGKGWRKKGEVTYSFIANNSSRLTRGLLANGDLHWIDFKEKEIVAFNLANEEFSLLPPPPFCRPGSHNYFEIRVLRGCICAFKTHHSGGLHIWSFKKKSCEWEDILNIADYNVRVLIDVYWPLAVTRRNEVLLRSNYKKLVRYDPESKSLEKLVKKIEDFGTYSRLIETIPHMNSFVSLKALGEISSKIR